MKIKKHQSNEYFLSGNYWIRNFTQHIKPYDINHITLRSDYKTLFQNELLMKRHNIPEIGTERFRFDECLIVSDGYNFDKYKHRLLNIDGNVCVIGVNRSLAKWKENDQLLKRQMNFFVVNNPYAECMSQLPTHRYFPKCVVSNRTYPEFAKAYQGTLYRYVPVPEANFKTDEASYYQIDDYRNPICAAIGLSYRFGVKKLSLFCCDDSFAQERPTAIQLENKLWTYPQHKISHHLIAGNLYWLKKSGVEVINYSSGMNYEGIETKSPMDLSKL